MRLVVDTGIHSKGWTREQAIDYMLAHSRHRQDRRHAEVERYIAIPSQALAYKTGAMTIQRLRRKAEAELGDKFDIREFHAQVLMTGSLPLAILEQKIDRWIAARRRPETACGARVSCAPHLLPTIVVGNWSMPQLEEVKP